MPEKETRCDPERAGIGLISDHPDFVSKDMSRVILALVALLVLGFAFFMLAGGQSSVEPAMAPDGTMAESKDEASGSTEPEHHAMEFNAENFDELVKSSDKPALVDFTATWCGPCQLLKPTINKLSAEYEGVAVIGKVDVEAHPGLAQEHQANAIPLLVFYKDGKVVERLTGLQSEEKIREVLENLVSP